MNAAEMMQALADRGYVVMDREEFDVIRAENAENDRLRGAIEQHRRTCRFHDDDADRLFSLIDEEY